MRVLLNIGSQSINRQAKVCGFITSQRHPTVQLPKAFLSFLDRPQVGINAIILKSKVEGGTLPDHEFVFVAYMMDVPRINQSVEFVHRRFLITHASIGHVLDAGTFRRLRHGIPLQIIFHHPLYGIRMEEALLVYS